MFWNLLENLVEKAKGRWKNSKEKCYAIENVVFREQSVIEIGEKSFPKSWSSWKNIRNSRKTGEKIQENRENPRSFWRKNWRKFNELSSFLFLKSPMSFLFSSIWKRNENLILGKFLSIARQGVRVLVTVRENIHTVESVDFVLKWQIN